MHGAISQETCRQIMKITNTWFCLLLNCARYALSMRCADQAAGFFCLCTEKLGLFFCLGREEFTIFSLRAQLSS